MAATNTFEYPLYDYAVGWFNRQPVNPLEFIAPALAVPGKHGTYKRYQQGYAFRAVNTLRARLSPANAIDVEAEDVPFLLADHSLRIGVDDSDLVPGAGTAKEAADQIAQSKINSLLATFRTSTIVDGFTYFREQVAAKTGKGVWSGASSEPIAELRELLAEYEAMNGVMPNRFLFSRQAWNTLGENGSVLDLVAYNAAKVLTPALLLDLLRLDAGSAQVQIATVPVGVAKPGAGVAFQGSNALGSEVWMTYVDEGELLGNMSGMRTLHAGDESPVESVESYYDRPAKTNWYEVGLHRAFAVTAPSCNMRLAVS